MTPASLDAATNTVRAHLQDAVQHRPHRPVIKGIRTPLGHTITATVSASPALDAAHLNVRLDIAETNRGETDGDLAINVYPSGEHGIEADAPEAWNVHMTLTTLLQILGATTERNTP